MALLALSRGARGLRLSLAAAAVAAAGCSGSGYTYVANSTSEAYFKVPEDWTLYDQEEVLERLGNTSPTQRARVQWAVAFDAAPQPSIDNILDGAAEYPTGYVRVRELTETEHDVLSLGSLRNAILPIDRIRQEEGPDAVEQLLDEDLVRPGGFRGNRAVYNVQVGDNVLTLDQTALVDATTRELSLFVVACESNCYLENQSAINDVVSSWTIKEQ